MTRIINFDHAAAAQLLPEVIASMEPFFQEIFGNPSSVHGVGQRVKKAVEEAREKVAALINAAPEEIVFTASGSEANNFAIKGVAFANQQKGKHLILSGIEHFSVLHAARSLEKLAFR
jgi:cysteine desulfurase